MILIDAGPLVALVDQDDQHHKKCVAALRGIHESLATVWPALTEAIYLLSDLPAGQDAVWEMLLRGAVAVLPLDAEDIPRIREIMHKYRDQAMDLADAALIRAGERENIHTFFTVDKRDFSVYRLNGRTRPRLLP